MKSVPARSSSNRIRGEDELGPSRGNLDSVQGEREREREKTTERREDCVTQWRNELRISMTLMGQEPQDQNLVKSWSFRRFTRRHVDVVFVLDLLKGPSTWSLDYLDSFDTVSLIPYDDLATNRWSRVLKIGQASRRKRLSCWGVPRPPLYSEKVYGVCNRCSPRNQSHSLPYSQLSRAFH